MGWTYVLLDEGIATKSVVLIQKIGLWWVKSRQNEKTNISRGQRQQNLYHSTLIYGERAWNNEVPPVHGAEVLATFYYIIVYIDRFDFQIPIPVLGSTKCDTAQNFASGFPLHPVLWNKIFEKIRTCFLRPSAPAAHEMLPSRVPSWALSWFKGRPIFRKGMTIFKRTRTLLEF